jgi:hypothetical protein
MAGISGGPVPARTDCTIRSGRDLNLERTGSMTEALHVGGQPTVQATWSLSRHLTAVATVSFFNAGRFLIETPPGQNVFYTTAFVAYRL